MVAYRTLTAMVLVRAQASEFFKIFLILVTYKYILKPYLLKFIKNTEEKMIQEELLRIANALNKSKISYALVGGLAVSSWVEPRATKDIDIIVNDINSTLLNETLENIGYTLRSAAMEINSIKFKRISKMMANDELFMLDLMQSNNLEYNNAIIDGATKISINKTELLVASPEDLILLKINSKRSKDQLDIINLKKLPHLNEQYITAWQKKLN